MILASYPKKICVVAAHPDDEILGCGGALARFAAHGAHVKILLLGEGPLARLGTLVNNLERERERERERESKAMRSALL